MPDDPGGTKRDRAARCSDRKIHGISLAKLVEPTHHCLLDDNSADQKLVESISIFLGEPECAPKDHGLMATDRVHRIETIIRELVAVDDCTLGVG